MKMKYKLTLGVLIAALATTSLRADLVSAKTDGIMELPVFYVYASGEGEPAKTSISVNADWKFMKSLDFKSAPALIAVEGLGDEKHVVSTPSIRTSLVSTVSKNN
jgi:hypothetical protein